MNSKKDDKSERSSTGYTTVNIQGQHYKIRRYPPARGRTPPIEGAAW